MAVIIDEFEVVPQREDEDRPQQQRSQTPPATAPTAAELERALRTLRERLDRVRAS